ncbi:MAG TPA: hypothetical protein DD733_08295, partial [Clostridiales bacterium]|nr:hypothetical protein [Clostridiales bacterium]
MSNTDFKLHSEYLIKLLRAALNSECISVMPDEIPAKIDMKKIFYLAKLHSVAPAVYPVIKDSPLPAARLFEEEYKRS